MNIELSWKDQEGRLDRLLRIVEAKDPLALAPGLLFKDVVVFTCQSLWHLKDWMLNDPEFGARSKDELTKDIHSEQCLLVCADIANRSKHYALTSTKTKTSHFRAVGMHVDARLGIHREYVWIVSQTQEPPYHGMEIREFFRECRAAWSKIIGKHYLSAIMEALVAVELESRAANIETIVSPNEGMHAAAQEPGGE